ncbi:hypothetical protein V8F06_011516 [Rhypophila decipiens]
MGSRSLAHHQIARRNLARRSSAGTGRNCLRAIHCESSDRHNRALATLFGLPEEHLSEWDGTFAFFHHLEICFRQLLKDTCFHIIWKLVGGQDVSSVQPRPVHVWRWCFAVIQAYESLSETDNDPSIEKTYQRLCEHARDKTSSALTGPPYRPSESEKLHILQAIFSVLCWTSMTLEPVIGEEHAKALPLLRPDVTGTEYLGGNSYSPECTTTLLARNCSHLYSSTDLRRPTSKMIRSFRPRMDIVEDQYESAYTTHVISSLHPTQTGTAAPPIDNFEDRLYEPGLNYASLSTIGRVRIRWVDTLTAHLEFDRATRELSLFRFPSFCVAKILSQHKVHVLESITETLLPSPYFPVHHASSASTTTNHSSSIYREILLSYRILFGQSAKSRKLILPEIVNPKKDYPYDITTHDRFLETLCTTPIGRPRRWPWHWRLWGRSNTTTTRSLPSKLFPDSVVHATDDGDDELIESDTYSAADDFPVFGPRLLAIQRYNMRRQPSRMMDLWRDRRNPLQWYTFWAVLLVGSAGLLLALLQLVVGVVQTAYTIHPSSEKG